MPTIRRKAYHVVLRKQLVGVAQVGNRLSRRFPADPGADHGSVLGLHAGYDAFAATAGWPGGAALIEPRRRAIDRLAREASDGPLPQPLELRTHDPVLLTAVQTIGALLLGMVFLMTTKPGLVGSLIVVGVALLLGLASGVFVSRTKRAPGQGMVARSERDKTLVG